MGPQEKPNGTPLNRCNRRWLLGLWPSHSLGGAAVMVFTVHRVTGKITRSVRAIKAKDRHEALAIAQRLCPDFGMAFVCNEE